MRTIYWAIVFTACSQTFVFPFKSHAIDLYNGTLTRQEINPGSTYIFRNYDAGTMNQEKLWFSDRGYMKRTYCFWHPTTLSYHPEVYNYHHYFNIVGHDAYFNSPNNQLFLPAASQSEQILTPAGEENNPSPQAVDSARLSRPNQKKLRK